MSRQSLAAKAGIAVVVAPCLWLAGWALWHYTRSWFPVDIPTSLSRGHIQTPEFKIKVESDYAICLETRDNADYPLDLRTAHASWSLRSGGKIVAGAGPVDLRWSSNFDTWVEVGRFHAEPGVYVLDLDLTSDLSPPNPHQPRLHVVEAGGRYQASIQHRNSALAGVLLVVPLPLSLLILAATARRREKWHGFLQHWTLTHPGPLPGVPVPGAPLKVSPRREPRQVAVRAFSVAGRFNLNDSVLCLIVLLMLLWVVFVIQEPYLPYGFAIRTARPGVKLLPIGGILPLRIRVLAGPHSMRGLQIGSQVIDPADFEAFLRREIPKRPPDWPVYIEGDSELEFESVARTIDAVSALRTNVVLLTPGMKADLGEPGRPPVKQ
jgi:hypothetical protein